MKLQIPTTIEAKETDTTGKHKYVVATRCGGLMEDPEIYYINYQIINADTPEEAKLKYDKINDCSFYYGQVLSEIKGEE